MAYTNELLSLLTRVRPYIREDELLPEPNELLKSDAKDHMDFVDIDGAKNRIGLSSALEKDSFATPTPKLREGYNPNSPFHYWWSGYADFLRLQQMVERYYEGEQPTTYFDFGCSSGRVLRHFAIQTDLDVAGCDIDLLNVRWVQRHLPRQIRVFQNTSLPQLPIEDNSVDIFSAYSVFSHIDLWEEAWLAEVRRILRPGGLAYITIQSQHTWHRVAEREKSLERLLSFEVSPKMELTYADFKKPMPHERIVFFLKKFELYVNTFMHTDYVEREWSRFLDVCTIFMAPKGRFQEGIVLRKPRR